MVSPHLEHFVISYGDAYSNDLGDLPKIARVSAPAGNTFYVEFLVQEQDPNNTTPILALMRELNFLILEKNEADPHAYMQYHCGTAANLYSSIHWAYHPAR